jgi:LPS O-antigen subunit length determinant protein (WzzB/FepE family)
MVIIVFVIAGFLIFAIVSFCIKQKYYEDATTKKNTSYPPLLDDSFSERVV